MSGQKQLWLLAGGNGAGKSAFYRLNLEPLRLPFVNAVILARQLHPDVPEQFSYEAARIAEHLCMQLLREGRSFCFETVFSHPSKLDFVAQAKALGYEIVLVFIHLDQVALNLARIAQRVSEGGHDVPQDKVVTRIPRTMVHIRRALPLCDHVYLLDNSRIDDPFLAIAEIHHGSLETGQRPLPAWAASILIDFQVVD